MVLKYKDMHAFDNYKTIKFIYNMYTAGENYPNLLAWRGVGVGGYDLSRLQTSMCVIREWYQSVYSLARC